MRDRPLRARLMTIVVALCSSSPALALTRQEHGPFSQMQGALAREHQREFARATLVGAKKTLYLKFTINPTGVAYILVQDSPDDSSARIEMVYGKLINARADDPHRIDALPDDVPTRSNLAKFIHRGAQGGDGVMLHGHAVVKLADGSEATSGFITVMANVTEGDNPAVNDTASVLETSNDDVPRLNHDFVAIRLMYTRVPRAITAP